MRSSVGVCDVSTFGKIDVQGPDAAALLDRIYANTIGTLKPGKVRYGMMLREDGFAFDDGTVARLAPDHFVVTTTTVNAGRVMQHLEMLLQADWPQLQVHATSVTEQWAAAAVSGPHARQVLAQIVDIDLSNAAFPFLAVGSCRMSHHHRPPFPPGSFRMCCSGEPAYDSTCRRDRGPA